MKKRPAAVCCVCDRDLYRAPTELGWADLGKRNEHSEPAGLCWDCTESYHRNMRRCLEAMGRGGTDEASQEAYAAGFNDGLVAGAESERERAERVPREVCRYCGHWAPDRFGHGQCQRSGRETYGADWCGDWEALR